MRTLLAVVLILMCQGGFAFGREAERADVALVRSLYAAFAWEAVLEDFPPQETLAIQPRAVLVKYFTPELSGLFRQDRECIARTQGLCNLDFMPIWDSQDATGAVVGIVGVADPGEVTVTVRYPQSGEKKLLYRLVNGPAGWRIADIVYRQGGGEAMSLSGLLAKSMPPDQPRK